MWLRNPASKLTNVVACLTCASLVPDLTVAQPTESLPVIPPFTAAVAPAPGPLDYEDYTYAMGPGLDGEPGINVTLLTYDANCTGIGPDTRITGDGTFSGSGFFVGEGTFTSEEGFDFSSFVVTNGTFTGGGICSGAGTLSTDDPESTLTIADGLGSINGTGLFHIPQGLFEGTGSFSGGSDLSFSNGSATLFGPGILNGTGTASGLYACTGSGILEGQGAFTGSGTFVGSGSYYATLPDDYASFLGTGILYGVGDCETGDVVGLDTGAIVPDNIADILDMGDAVYEEVTTVQESLAPEPAPAVTG